MKLISPLRILLLTAILAALVDTTKGKKDQKKKGGKSKDKSSSSSKHTEKKFDHNGSDNDENEKHVIWKGRDGMGGRDNDEEGWGFKFGKGHGSSAHSKSSRYSKAGHHKHGSKSSSSSSGHKGDYDYQKRWHLKSIKGSGSSSHSKSSKEGRSKSSLHHYHSKSSKSKSSKSKSSKSKSSKIKSSKSKSSKSKSSKSKSSDSKSRREHKMREEVLKDLMNARRKGSHGSKGSKGSKGKPKFPNEYAQCTTNFVTACEDSGRLKLKCPSGTVIRVIDANFGRTQPDNEVCPHDRKHQDKTDCYNPSTKEKVQCHCNNMKMCVLKPETKYFGDPCPGTYKYLEVEYVCVIHQRERGFRRKLYRDRGGKKSPSDEICVPPCPSHCGLGEQCLLKKHKDGSLISECACKASSEKCGGCKDEAGLTCSASGDPHYKTFDGKKIHFQGTCRYLLSGTVENTTEPEFQVLVENEHRNGKTWVAYTKTVIVLVHGLQIILRKGGVVLVDNVIVTLPYSDISGVYIEFTSRGTVVVETDFGLRVEYDGKHKAYVTLPPNYCSEVEGICGNMNGKKNDDCVTKDGEDVSNHPDIYSKIGNSWKVYSDDIEGCVDPDSDIDVPDEIPDECNVLTGGSNSPLLQCIDELPNDAKQFLEDCSYDCAEGTSSGKSCQEVACSVIEAFVEFCEDILDTVLRDWRDDANCPMVCPDGFVYSDTASGCPATCEDPDAPDSCDLPEREGCVCAGDRVLEGEQCVEREECGCIDDNGSHHKQGEVWLSDDCTNTSRCTPSGITSSPHMCEDDQYCGVLDGARQCVDEEPLPDNPCDTVGGYLKCLTCTAATSDRDCRQNGEWVTCNGDDAICLEEIVSVPFTSKGVQITRRCISKPECKALIHQQGGVCSKSCRLPLCRSCDYQHAQCAVDCCWGPWKPYGKCSNPCGPGMQTFRRLPDSPRAKNGGKPCDGSPIKQTPCFLKECAEDGGWCDFEEWSPCSKRCGLGRQVRKRSCKCPAPQNGGRKCKGLPMDIKSCIGRECPVNGDWSEWSNFGECKGICGVGVMQRTRTCSNPAPSIDPLGKDCDGREWDVEKCRLPPCVKPVDGSWGPWCEYGPCSVSCGMGEKTRTRMCDDPAPQHGGQDCVGNGTDTTPCFAGTCPINESYPCEQDSYLQCFSCHNEPGDAACEANGQWETCTGPDQICTKREVSTKNMKRVFRGCINRRACQAQQRNGVCLMVKGVKTCVTCSYGDLNQDHRCPVDGGWCDFGEFGDCSVSCGRGVKVQTRNCSCPEPQNGGKGCEGRNNRPMICNDGCCPVDGGWGPWRDWSPCSVTCGVGKQMRRRLCNQPSPDCGGATCQVDGQSGAIKTRECDAGECADKKPNPCETDEGSRSVLQCWSCDNQTSEANCASNGHFETCIQDDPVCMTSVKFSSSSKSISRGCKERDSCHAEQAANGAVCSTKGMERNCVFCNFRMSKCAEPPEYPCPKKSKLWCFTCEGASKEECRENGKFELCNGADQDMCYRKIVVDSLGAETSVSRGCKPRSQCEALSADISEVCSEESGATSCIKCGYRPRKFKCMKAKTQDFAGSGQFLVLLCNNEESLASPYSLHINPVTHNNLQFQWTASLFKLPKNLKLESNLRMQASIGGRGGVFTKMSSLLLLARYYPHKNFL